MPSATANHALTAELRTARIKEPKASRIQHNQVALVWCAVPTLGKESFVWCPVAEGGVGPVGVVLLAVVLGHNFGLQQGMEHLDREQLVAEFAVEGFDESVLPRCSWFDEH